MVTSAFPLNDFLWILRGPGWRGQRLGAPGAVPLQNPKVTAQKACLSNGDKCRDEGRISVKEKKEQ